MDETGDLHEFRSGGVAAARGHAVAGESNNTAIAGAASGRRRTDDRRVKVNLSCRCPR